MGNDHVMQEMRALEAERHPSIHSPRRRRIAQACAGREGFAGKRTPSRAHNLARRALRSAQRTGGPATWIDHLAGLYYIATFPIRGNHATTRG